MVAAVAGCFCRWRFARPASVPLHAGIEAGTRHIVAAKRGIVISRRLSRRALNFFSQPLDHGAEHGLRLGAPPVGEHLVQLALEILIEEGN